jgi:hypothetical protein
MTELPIAAASREGGDSRAPRYALIFRTHFWDGFADRQFRRAAASAPGADLWVLVDETRGRVEGVPTNRVFRLTDGQILEAGYVAAGEGSIQWYSGDVPLYMFRAAHPDYDHYVQMEYDVNFHLDVDALVARIARDGTDMVALTKGEATDEWPWLDSCLDVYRPEEVRHQLICIGAFSGRALDVLARERLAQAQSLKAGAIRAWPYCEGFLATEAAKQGLNTRELSDYGDVDAYDWWPPYVETDLPRLQRFAFVHPVLDEKRYVPSLFKRPMLLGTLLSPRSWFGRKLRRLGPAGYLRALRTPEYRQMLRELSRSRYVSFKEDRLG